MIGSRRRTVTGAFRARAWRGLWYLLVGLPFTALAWLVAFAVVVAGALLSLTVVGARTVPALLWLTRATAAMERHRCGLMRPAPARAYRAVSGLKGRLGDPATWRDLFWALLGFPVNLVGLLTTLTLWIVGLGLTSLPIWYRFLPDGRATLYESGGVSRGVVDTVPAAMVWVPLGVLMVWLAGWSARGFAVGEAKLAAGLLSPTSASRLRSQVVTLTRNRAAAVRGQQESLHRIERDLHDGAQARLVALAADLGLAGEAFDADPTQARQLVEQARDGVVLALAELRDLVRGIGPPVLTDRGLAAAVEGVAASSPIPVTVTVELSGRLPSTVEEAAYFMVCECLTNSAKHSSAPGITVDIQMGRVVGTAREGCAVTVSDNGVGGADVGGAGLRGLADRVAAVDGVLTVDSPIGGPTRIRTVLPCAW